MRGACCYIAAATAVLVSGCDQASDPSPSSGPAGTPAYDFSKGPASAGPVVRFQGHYVTFLTDVDANLTVIVGTPNRIDEFCGPGDIDVEPVDVQLVFNPTGALHEVDLGSNLPVLVYGAATPVFDVCNDLVGAPLLATGTGHMVYLDNSTGGGPGAHSVGSRRPGHPGVHGGQVRSVQCIGEVHSFAQRARPARARAGPPALTTAANFRGVEPKAGSACCRPSSFRLRRSLDPVPPRRGERVEQGARLLKPQVGRDHRREALLREEEHRRRPGPNAPGHPGDRPFLGF